MKFQNLLKTWGPFILLTLLTMLVYEFAWASDDYQRYLAVTGVLCVVAAAWVIYSTGFNWRSALFVLIGLLAGQWWFLESLLMQASWLFKGFV